MARDYKQEYEKESQKIDQLKVKIPKELHQKFIEKLDGVSKSKWILDKIQEFIDGWPFGELGF